MTVGVVLVNWNGGEFTIPCIDSLCQGRIVPDSIVVVDNNSSDGSVDRIQQTFPKVTIIRNATNVGFAAASNQGIAHLQQANVDYIWILNNDTTVSPLCLAELMKAAGEAPDGAGFSAKIFYDDQRRLWYAGAYRHPLHHIPKHIHDERLENSSKHPVKVPFLSGCCMFVPSKVFAAVGLFRSRYVAYSEDSEWCWRATKTGWDLYYVPTAIVYHRVSASVVKNTNTRTGRAPYISYLMIRNHLWTVRLHVDSIPRRLLALAASVGIELRNAVRAALQKRDLATCRGIARGIVAGIREDPV
jgi:GT2 family glycosyltransferase